MTKKEIWNDEIRSKLFLINPPNKDEQCNIYGDLLPKFNNSLSLRKPKFKVVNFNDPKINNEFPLDKSLPYAHHIWRFQVPRPKLNIFANLKQTTNKSHIIKKISNLYRSKDEINDNQHTEGDYINTENTNILSLDGSGKEIEKLKGVKSNKKMKISKSNVFINNHGSNEIESEICEVKKLMFFDKFYNREKNLIKGFSDVIEKEKIVVPKRKVHLSSEYELVLKDLNTLKKTNPIVFEIQKKKDDYDLKRLKLKRKQAEFYSKIFTGVSNK